MHEVGYLHSRRVRTRFWPTRALVPLALLAAGPFAACGDDLDFTQREGTYCQDCSKCESYAGSCVCDTCTPRAFDPDTNTLLICDNGWRKLADCPGGVAVGCSDGDLWLECLDESGIDVVY